MSKISFKGIKNKVLVRIFLHPIQNNTRIVCFFRQTRRPDWRQGILTGHFKKTLGRNPQRSGSFPSCYLCGDYQCAIL